MSQKNDVPVVINNKVYTLSGFESEEYLQNVASYINGKIQECQSSESYRRFNAEYQSVLLALNIADDYFKAKLQVNQMLTEDDDKDKQIYDLRHEVIETQIKYESAQKMIDEYKEKVNALQREIISWKQKIMLNRPEILAPAGSMDALKAAVSAGADACYAGGDMFSARAFAGNFDTTELLEAIDYCHIHNVKLYMAVNTLLKNSEMKKLIPYLEPFYREGVDGIIVQDVGVIRSLSQAYPDLPLHGSTQMSVCSTYGAEFLKNLGLTRFVPARELSLKEIKSIKEAVDIEIETFVHGAMCFCYSGKCLMSSFAGGRSGNRGRCAQPCRKAYNSRKFNHEYALSMKDMCTLADLPQLIEAGIDSFKIEGRMKKPEYVAAAVHAYSEITDEYINGHVNEKRIKYHTDRLMDIYNRGGFSSGYYYMKNGKEMLANKRPNHTGTLIGKVEAVEAPMYTSVWNVEFRQRMFWRPYRNRTEY